MQNQQVFYFILEFNDAINVSHPQVVITLEYALFETWIWQLLC